MPDLPMTARRASHLAALCIYGSPNLQCKWLRREIMERLRMRAFPHFKGP